MTKEYKIFHLDLHQLSKGITIQNSHHSYYLLGVLDAYSRAVWVEVLESKRALEVMFAALKRLIFWMVLCMKIDDLKSELLEFLVYYNEYRPHSSLDDGLTPKEFIKKSENVN